jgi:TM2 domain-containing membrane protein YozV
MGMGLAFGLFFWLFMMGFAAAIYFLPTIIAVMAHRRNAPLVALVNTLLGWSFVGWIVSLVMAVTREPQLVQVVHVHQQIANPQMTYEPPQSQRRNLPGTQIRPVDRRD